MWLELLKDYDMSVRYYPSKANVVANVLSRVIIARESNFEDDGNRELENEVHRLATLGMRSSDIANGSVIVLHVSKSLLIEDIKTKQEFNIA